MKYLFVSFLICISVNLFAQQDHFIYVQADNRQPFYIKLDKKIMSSSTSGYLIIPKLQNGTYDLSIGFPKNEWPEQKVTCSVNKNDAGYLLKNFGEKGWGLFNFQTLDLVMADNRVSMDSSKSKENKDDAFSTVLSNVVNDPAIRMAEEIKEDSITTTLPVKKETVKKETKPALKNKGKAVVINNNKDRISKLHSKKYADGLSMVYVDMVKGEADTINVMIPVDKPAKKILPEKKLEEHPVDVVVKAGNKKLNQAKNIAANKKPGKKINEPNVDLAKSDNIKNKAELNDTATIIPAEKKMEEPKVDLAKNDIIIADAVKDSSAIIQPGKTIDALKVEVVKEENKNRNALNDTVAIVQPEKKTEEPKVDLVKADDKIIIPATDSITNKIPEKKVEETKVDLVKEDAKNPPVQSVDSTFNNSMVQADTISKISTEPITAVTKTEKAVVEEKPKETNVERSNTNNPVMNRVCNNVADGDEFLGLLKKMNKSKSDNEMLYHAHLLFLKRCFTTKQIERLSLLFKNDLGKYNLFDDAYHFIIDPENFSSLQIQLTDDYYIKRFKAMIR